MNAVEIYKNAEFDLEHNRITLGEFEERIKPLTDVEHVVRCKDCEYRREWFCELDGHCHSPNFYCANGRRKDGDDNAE